jgi:hypothetical protein
MKIHSGLPKAQDIERIRTFLEQDEAANNLPLGLLPRPDQQPEPTEEEQRPFFAFVEHDGQIVFVMMMTPPHNVIVYGAGEHVDEAIETSIMFLI